MRYNTYRQYKTLSGYNSHTKTIQRNYQFQWRSYDLINTIPSNVFQQLTEESSQYEAGCTLRLIVGKDNFIRRIDILKKDKFLGEYVKINDLTYEPNSYMYYISDPDLRTDSSQDIQVTAYDSNNNIVQLRAMSGYTTSAGKCYAATWSLMASRDDPSSMYTYVILRDSTDEWKVQTYFCVCDYLQIDYKIDSDDIQGNISPIIAYIPTFVPADE